jgi:hypothetical protein
MCLNPAVQSAQQAAGRDLKNITDAEKRRERDRTTSLDLLPVACREPERNHIFLAVTRPPA